MVKYNSEFPEGEIRRDEMVSMIMSLLKNKQTVFHSSVSVEMRILIRTELKMVLGEPSLYEADLDEDDTQTDLRRVVNESCAFADLNLFAEDAAATEMDSLVPESDSEELMAVRDSNAQLAVLRNDGVSPSQGRR